MQKDIVQQTDAESLLSISRAVACICVDDMHHLLVSRVSNVQCVLCGSYSCHVSQAFLARLSIKTCSVAVAGMPSNTLTNLQWSERATAVMSFLVLLAGALGGVQCLTNMNFKRDTLLFGSAKSD